MSHVFSVFLLLFFVYLSLKNVFFQLTTLPVILYPILHVRYLPLRLPPYIIVPLLLILYTIDLDFPISDHSAITPPYLYLFTPHLST